MVRLTAAFFAAVLTLCAADDLDSQIKSLISVYASLESNAADPVASEQAFYQGAIPGLLRVLDPHSVFFDPGPVSTSSRRWKHPRKRGSAAWCRYCPDG